MNERIIQEAGEIAEVLIVLTILAFVLSQILPA